MPETYEDMLNNCDEIEDLRQTAIELYRAVMGYERAVSKLDPETRARVMAAAFDYVRTEMIMGMPEGEFKDSLRDLELQRLRQRLGDDFANEE